MSWSKANNAIFTLVAIAFGGIALIAFNRQRNILRVSKAFIGQQERSGNSGFQNPEMEKLMREVGWRSGDAWCVYFVKLMWFLDAPEYLKPKIKSAISGSSQQTWANVNNDPAFKVSRIPKPGDIVIWQNFKNGVGLSTGHAGIVKRVNVNDFVSIEGNTNVTGSTEGIEVAEKVRGYNFNTQNGLRLKGFVRLT